MKRKHSEEIRRWADSPYPVDVWFRGCDSLIWSKTNAPAWKAYNLYIVDDNWAGLRKSQEDGKQLQVNVSGKVWIDKTLDYDRMIFDNPLMWRIKEDDRVCHWKSHGPKLNSWKVECNDFYFYLNNTTDVVKGFNKCPYCGDDIEVEFNPEVTYEWQWAWLDRSGTYHFTGFYSTEKAARENVTDEKIVRFEPSKREKE